MINNRLFLCEKLFDLQKENQRNFIFDEIEKQNLWGKKAFDQIKNIFFAVFMKWIKIESNTLTIFFNEIASKTTSLNVKFHWIYPSKSFFSDRMLLIEFPFYKSNYLGNIV